MLNVTTKLSRNQFRCFKCRNVFAQKDGDWFDWDSAQVHLCRRCDKATENDPNRPQAGAKG